MTRGIRYLRWSYHCLAWPGWISVAIFLWTLPSLLYRHADRDLWWMWCWTKHLWRACLSYASSAERERGEPWMRTHFCSSAFKAVVNDSSGKSFVLVHPVPLSTMQNMISLPLRFKRAMCEVHLDLLLEAPFDLRDRYFMGYRWATISRATFTGSKHAVYRFSDPWREDPRSCTLVFQFLWRRMSASMYLLGEEKWSVSTRGLRTSEKACNGSARGGHCFHA